MEIRRIIGDLRDKGKTVFFSSHELSEAETVCDHVIIAAHGRILAAGASSELLEPGKNLERYFMEVVRDS